MASPPATLDLTTDPNPKPNAFQEPKIKIWITISVFVIIVLFAAYAIYRCIKAHQLRQQALQQQLIEMVAALSTRVYHLAGDAEECTICLEEFQDQEQLMEVPGCRHGFHRECIEKCLRYHRECPNCRAQIST